MTSAGRRALVALAAVSLTIGVIVAAGGGVRASAGGLRFSASSPVPALALAAAAIIAWLVLAGRDGSRAALVRSDLTTAWAWLDRRAGWIIASLAGASGAAAIFFHTFAASGADASGYLSQAALWTSGRLLFPDTLAASPSWPLAPWATTPLGWQPWAGPGFQAPTYAAGLPLLMAVPHALGGGVIAGSLIVPVAATLAVAATGGVARALAGGPAGMLAALLLAVSPAFVYQSFQPMSDVPVTAAWMGCWWVIARHAGSSRGFPTQVPHEGSSRRFVTEVLLAGVAAAVAVLIRPNLAPAVVAPLWVAAVPGPRAHLVWFAMPVALAALAVAGLNWHWYGSPLRSGYGAADEIYALANIWPNVKAYGGWMIETQPVLMLAPLALFVLRTRLTVWLCLFALLVEVAYLAYGVFDVWSYLRFLLPAIAVGAVLVGGLGARTIHTAPAACRAPALLVLALAILAQGLLSGRSHGVTRIGDEHRRMALAGPYLAAALPRDAVIIAGEQSGAVRYYTGRPILRWESIEPDDLSEIIVRLRSQGHDLWWVLDQWEEPLVREKFAGLRTASLDWPPQLEAGPLMATRAYRIADREAFLSGRRGATDRLR